MKAKEFFTPLLNKFLVLATALQLSCGLGFEIIKKPTTTQHKKFYYIKEVEVVKNLIKIL